MPHVTMMRYTTRENGIQALLYDTIQQYINGDYSTVNEDNTGGIYRCRSETLPWGKPGSVRSTVSFLCLWWL